MKVIVNKRIRSHFSYFVGRRSLVNFSNVFSVKSMNEMKLNELSPETNLHKNVSNLTWHVMLLTWCFCKEKVKILDKTCQTFLIFNYFSLSFQIFQQFSNSKSKTNDVPLRMRMNGVWNESIDLRQNYKNNY